MKVFTPIIQIHEIWPALCVLKVKACMQLCMLKERVFYNHFLTVDIREIKEVHVGMDSQDFDAQQLELEKFYKNCFAVYYGSEFNLKTLSVAGES